MESREDPHMDKCKEVVKDWNFDTSCMCASLPVSISGNLNCLTSYQSFLFTDWCTRELL